MQNEERPIKLILDCPLTGKTVVAHMSEDQLDLFIERCGKEQRKSFDWLNKTVYN